MDVVRLGRTVFDAVIVSMLLSVVFLPPDPIAQLLFLGPLFVVALPFAYRYGPWIHRYGPARHLLVFAGVFAVQFAWSYLVRVDAVVPRFHSPVRVVLVLGGLGIGAWLAYFGGVERIRTEVT